MPVTKETCLNELFKLSKESLKGLEHNEEFIVKELFRGVEWNRIPKGLRTKLGGQFYAYACGEGSTILNPLGKTPQNQQRYQYVG